MEKMFFYYKDGVKTGPVNAEYLKKLARDGVITSETIIEDERGRRVAASKVSGLFSNEPLQTFETTIPPVPPPVYTPSENTPYENTPEKKKDEKKYDPDFLKFRFKTLAKQLSFLSMICQIIAWL